MSKYNVKQLWEQRYGKTERVFDYAGRVMLKSACGNPNSGYEPTIDHVRPISKGGRDCVDNLVICHWKTNEEKNDEFPHWQANGNRFRARREKGKIMKYVIEELE